MTIQEKLTAATKRPGRGVAHNIGRPRSLRSVQDEFPAVPWRGSAWSELYPRDCGDASFPEARKPADADPDELWVWQYAANTEGLDLVSAARSRCTLATFRFHLRARAGP